MKTKEYLGQIKRYDCMINNGLKEIQKYQDMATSITTTISGDKVQSSPEQDKLGKAVANIVDIGNEIFELTEKYKVARNEIVFRLQRIENVTFYNLLYKRYVLCMDLYDIADEMGVSYGRIKNLSAESLGEFERLYGKEYKNKKLPYLNVTKK